MDLCRRFHDRDSFCKRSGNEIFHSGGFAGHPVYTCCIFLSAVSKGNLILSRKDWRIPVLSVQKLDRAKENSLWDITPYPTGKFYKNGKTFLGGNALRLL